MATEFCSTCKQSHPGRVCDYDDKGECAETADVGGTIEKKPIDAIPQRESEPSSGPEEDHRHR